MQRVKGHGNPGGVRNGTETNEHENVNNWTHRVWPISSAAANYYGTTYPYATYCVGDASGNAWPAGEQITYVSSYNGQLPPDAAAYGMEGVYNPPVGAAYAAAYAQPVPNNGAYNYYPAAADYSAVAAAAAGAPHPWNAAVAAKAYENYYEDPVAAAAALKNIDQRLQSLDMVDTAASKLYAGVGAGGGEKKTTTWASIAKQPAKPMPQTSSGGSKKKGPGMPPPPMVPGRNIDLNPWESKVNSGLPKAPMPVMQAPLAPPPPSAIGKTAVWNGPTLVAELPPPLMPACDLTAPPPHQIHPPHAAQLPPPQFDVSAPPPALPRKMYAAPSGAPVSVASSPSPPPVQLPAPTTVPAVSQVAAVPQTTAATSHLPAPSLNSTASTAAQPAPTASSSVGHSKSNESSGGGGGGSSHSSSNTSSSGVYSNSAASLTATAVCSNASSPASSSCSSSSSSSTCSSSARSPPAPAHSVVDKLRDKNNYNPRLLELPPEGTRFFVIKSYSEDDVHRSIKYEIWCSTERGNKRLDDAYADQKATGGGAVYLFFSVNGSGHFCGVAQMCSPVDYGASSSVWAQDKWKGQFGVRWVYVKDVPNSQLRHIRLENNENKPVTNSRDTQEVPYDKGLSVFKIIHAYSHTTSIFDDFTHYEKRQKEGDSNKRDGPGNGGGNGGGGGGGGGAPMQRGGLPPPNRPNPFATRGSSMYKDREGGGGSSFSQMNQNRRGGRNSGSVGFTNHRSNHSSMLRS